MTYYEERIDNQKENKNINNENKPLFRQMKNLPQAQRARMCSGKRPIRDEKRNIRQTELDGKQIIKRSTSKMRYINNALRIYGSKFIRGPKPYKNHTMDYR